MAVGLLVPRDVLKPRRPDDHFVAEADAARAAEIAVSLLDHDAAVAGDLTEALRGISAETAGSRLLYRGWMITPARYVELEQVLVSRGVELVTSAAQFRRAHHLPEWYDAMHDFTPRSAWTTSSDRDELLACVRGLPIGPAVLKDYSKSEKHYWHEAMFIPDLSDTEHLLRVADRFVELRGSAFDTGFVVREFEPLPGPEARSWWRDGECVAVTAHPDTPNERPESIDVGAMRQAVSSLGLGFITIDLAVHGTSGQTRVVELGDGQVSDRPTTTDPSELIAAILAT